MVDNGNDALPTDHFTRKLENKIENGPYGSTSKIKTPRHIGPNGLTAGTVVSHIPEKPLPDSLIKGMGEIAAGNYAINPSGLLVERGPKRFTEVVGNPEALDNSKGR